ncbi:MAG: M3 family oligoendopeptidase [Ruminococcaceae bacterium]|nr:M3 family oligoendopeptidase [Oscillospiraceae bacterium]
MNECWNLDPLYRGFSDPNYAGDLQALKVACARFETFTKTLSEMEPKQALRGCIDALEEINNLTGALAEYASLRQATDATDAEAASALGQVMAVVSSTAGADARFRSYAAQVENLEQVIAEDEVLSQYGFFFRMIKEKSSYLLSAQAESILARMSLSGSSAWSDLQSHLTSTLEVPYNGGTTNLSAIRNLAYDGDGAVRKAAYEAEIASYDKIKDAVAFALNSIKLETLNEAQLRGYESPLDMTLKHANMSKATLDAMLEAMDEYLPKFWAYLKAKAKALGYEGSLPWYEMFAPMGGSSKTYTTEEARDYLVNLFGTFDGQLRDMVAEAFANAWIDFYPRAGKRGGAFCAGVEKLGESRILTNYDGSFSDIVTLAHELGHAFHNLQIRDHRPLNKDYSMPVAETASTFNECVIMAAAIAAATDKEEKLALIESQLQDATQIICDIYSRFRFEASVFARRNEEFLSADRLCELMVDAQKKSYGDGLAEETLHPFMWVCKGHYYGPIFYNFPYAFGGLFARGLYAQYEKEGEAFLPKYKKLLHETTVRTVEEAAMVADIDLTDKAFWRQGLQVLADEIDLFISLLEE